MLFRRVDPALNMYRWYSLSVQPTLFDSCAVICAWGRMRTLYQRMRIIPAASLEQAMAIATKIAAKKVRRGYKETCQADCQPTDC